MSAYGHHLGRVLGQVDLVCLGYVRFVMRVRVWYSAVVTLSFKVMNPSSKHFVTNEGLCLMFMNLIQLNLNKNINEISHIIFSY
jgi:hypothetical protein